MNAKMRIGTKVSLIIFIIVTSSAWSEIIRISPKILYDSIINHKQEGIFLRSKGQGSVQLHSN